MSTTTCLASDPIATALSWIASRGVEIRQHTSSTAGALDAPVDHPVLHLVDVGVEAPRCTELEDWVRHPIDLDELYARSDHLLARAQRMGASLVRISEDDTLHVGSSIIILSEQEVRLMGTLVDHLGELVLRDDLAAVVWPEGPPQDPRALDNRVKALRRRLEGTPLQIHTVRGRGLLLERTAT